MPKPLLLDQHVTDKNQQVHCEIVAAKVIEEDLYEVEVKFSDGSKGEGEMLSGGGREPKKGEEWKLQREDRENVPTVVKTKGEDGKETETLERQNRSVVTGYKL